MGKCQVMKKHVVSLLKKLWQKRKWVKKLALSAVVKAALIVVVKDTTSLGSNMIGKRFGPDISYNRSKDIKPKETEVSRKPASTPTLRDRVIQYFKKKGVYNKYAKDGSLTRRIAKGIKMAQDAKNVKDEPKSQPVQHDTTLLKSAIAGLEKGPSNISHSGAMGRYQFTQGTTKALNKKYGTNLDRSNSEDQEKLMDLLIKDNKSLLEDLGENDTALYMAHNIGASATKKILNSSNASELGVNKLRSTLWKNNPAYFFKKVGRDNDKLVDNEPNILVNALKDNPKEGIEELKNKGFVPLTMSEIADKYERKVGEGKQQAWNSEAEQARNNPPSPMKTLQEPVKEEEEKRDSVRKMKIARKANFGIY
tara:strand:+ start:135 stop:1232 length:1098 start_codon:yes stop_codon:yes gene_type:complete